MMTTDIHTVIDPAYTLLPQFAPLMDAAVDAYNNTNLYGKRVPVVMINARVIIADELEDVFLDFRGTYPCGYVIVKDVNNSIYQKELPGTDNLIMITIVPKSNESYRKIKITGYIVSVDNYGNNIYRYNFKYKYIPLENAVVRSWSLLTTFELFKAIATETKLGLAVGEKVEDVSDIRYRYCCGLKLKDFLQSQICFSGNSEDTVMDFWLDPWGYLNIVNLTHQTTFLDENSTISMTVGQDTTSGDIGETVIFDQKVPKLITNLDFGERLNINIEKYEFVTDNSVTGYYGNSYIDYVSYTQETSGEDETSTILTESVMPGLSSDSYNTETNKFSAIEYSGFEMDNIPAMPQVRSRNNILGRLNGSGAIFTMAQPNFGLAKGQQIPVILVSYGRSKEHNTDIEADDIIETNFSRPVFDEYHSGIYYITGVTYQYDKVYEEISQKIYATKLTPSVSSNYFMTKDDGTINILPSSSGISVLENELNGN